MENIPLYYECQMLKMEEIKLGLTKKASLYGKFLINFLPIYMY